MFKKVIPGANGICRRLRQEYIELHYKYKGGDYLSIYHVDAEYEKKELKYLRNMLDSFTENEIRKIMTYYLKNYEDRGYKIRYFEVACQNIQKQMKTGKKYKSRKHKKIGLLDKSKIKVNGMAEDYEINKENKKFGDHTDLKVDVMKDYKKKRG